MKSKKKIIAIIIAIILVIAIVVIVLATQSDKNYVDTVVNQTEVVTDENGDPVLDEEGNAVTVTVTQSDEQTTASSDSDNESTAASDSNDESTTASGEDTTTKKSTTSASESSDKTTESKSSKTTSSSATTTKKSTDKTTQKTTESTTKETTTEKPKKREVTVKIKIPYYYNEATEMTVYYKVLDEDEKYTAMDAEEITFDGSVQTVVLPEKLKGDVKVLVRFSQKEATENTVTIPYNESVGYIYPSIGIEILDGEDL